MSVSIDTNTLAQQIKDVALGAVNTVKEAVVGTESATSTEDKHRVFIGNLNFETTEDELKTLFSQAGEIVSVTLPTRRNYRTKSSQPSGIAFIGYTSDAEAEKAVETLNGKTLGAREINVAIARPLAERKPKAKPTPKNTAKDQETVKDTEVSAGEATAPVVTDGDKKKRARKPKVKKANGDSAPETADESAPQTTEPAQKTKTTRAPREKGPPSDGVPSKTTLFVAGLDHKTTDAELKEIFSQFNPTTAHVALRPIPRFMIKKLAEKGEQRLSRGFGFVTFADQEAQSSALKAMDGHKVSDERALAVKVAVETAKLEHAAATAPDATAEATSA